MNRWFLDTEFNEDGKTIELISIALVSEKGDEYYAHCDGYDVSACNDWVKQNVLPHVAHMPPIPREQVAKEIMEAVGPEPEFWAYYAAYDWVALCQLFGRMLDLPTGWPLQWPKYCLDLKQLMLSRNLNREDLPEQEGTVHSALDDARWVRDSYLYIKHREKKALDDLMQQLRTGEFG